MVSDEMPVTPAVIAIDWGTSNVRCWLMASDGQVLARARSDKGMSRLSPSDYPDALTELIADFPVLPDNLPVIICGMAGAKTGWQEAPYIAVPAAFSALGAQAVAITHPSFDIRIIPGLAQIDSVMPDVMRGEETLLYGAHLSGALRDGAKIVLPGTHAKWVTISGQEITQFSTTMTGELYHLLSMQSLLAASLETDIFDEVAFCNGVQDGYTHPETVISKLFALRAGPLLGVGDKTSGASLLSGRLIGAEIATNYKAGDGAVLLVASGSAAALYQSAFAQLQIESDVIAADEMAQTALFMLATEIWPAIKAARR